MQRLNWRRLDRGAISAGFIAAFVVGCVRLPHINDATVALLMVLWIVGVAIKWGWAEALTTAIVGGICFDYFFLGPPGFAITAAEYGVALAAFVVTAFTTARLTARLKRHEIEAVGRQAETEKLYTLVNAMLNSSSAEATLAQLADKVTEIFGTDGVAIYDKQAGRIVRSGPRSSAVSDHALREITASGYSPDETASGFSLAPIQYGSELGGSIAIHGDGVSKPLVRAIASMVGLGMARLHAIEKSAKAEIVRGSEELKSAALDAMAHEMRNPLYSAKLAATTLLSGHLETELQKQEMLAIIDEELDRMDQIIDEAIQLAGLEANEISLHKEPQNLARLIPAAIGEMGALAASRQIQLRVPESLPPAECDKDMILKVFKQLLNNALKHSPKGSPLTVSADATGARIVISVADCGPGVPEEEHHQVFEKYYRGRAVGLGVPGTGLGLASAKCIMQAHGGEIWVTSPPAGGAAFHVSLPVASASYTVGAMR